MGVIKFLPKIEEKKQLRSETGCFVAFIASFATNEGDTLTKQLALYQVFKMFSMITFIGVGLHKGLIKRNNTNVLYEMKNIQSRNVLGIMKTL